ncbi:hypothetical protein ACFLU6_08955 [Acidobacteriota bacterium]
MHFSSKGIFVCILACAGAFLLLEAMPALSQESSIGPLKDTTLPSPTPEEAKQIQDFVKKIKRTRSYLQADIAFRGIRELGVLPLVAVIDLSRDPALTPEIRIVVIRNMLRFDHPLVYPEALTYIDHENLHVRRFALAAIQKFGGKSATQVALRKLDDPEVIIRTAALAMILEHAAPEHYYLFDKLKDSEDADIRIGAMMLLRNIDPQGYEDQYLEMLTDNNPSVYNLAADYVDELRKRPSPEKLLPYASSPKSYDRIYFLYVIPKRYADRLKAPLDVTLAGLFVTVPDHMQKRNVEVDPRVGQAIKELMSDPVEEVRLAALRACPMVLENEYSFFYDKKMLGKIVKMKDEKSPIIRKQVLDLVYRDSMKVGLALPSSQPERLSRETMQALHWETDNLTIPLLISALKDPDKDIRKAAFRYLKFSTGQAFGLADFWDRKVPDLTPDIIQRWESWWKIQKEKTVQERTVQMVDQLVNNLPGLIKDDKQARDTIMALRIVTGWNFGWKPTLSNAQKMYVYNKWTEWWDENKSKHRAQWIIDAINSIGLDYVRPQCFHILSRVSNRSFGFELFIPLAKKKISDQLTERFNTWWKEYKQQNGIKD